MAKRKRYLKNIEMHDKKLVSTLSSPVSASWVWSAIGSVLLIALYFMLRLHINPVEVFAKAGHFFSVHALLAILSSTAACAGGFVYGKHRLSRTHLKMLSLESDGILVGMYRVQDEDIKGTDARSRIRKFAKDTERKEGRGPTEKLLWQDIEKMDIADDFSLADANHRYLYIQMKPRNPEEKWSPVMVYRIKWDNITAWVSPERFFNEVQTKIPDALTEDVLDAAKSDSDDVQYTHLWLQYFSTPTVRQRKGALPGGTIVGDGTYEIERKLGGGGQGTAYLAKTLKALCADASKELPEKVVLKEYVLPVHRGEHLEKSKTADLNHEAEILGRIDNPNIVSLIDCFVEDHRGYLVLEYIEGESLADRVKREGRQSEEQVISWAMNICDILFYLHSLSPPIIHRDLTPDNLMIQKDGIIKLMDFTVAHQLESVTTATMVGKQAYIPPEQFSGKAGPESDIYALGCTMHYLLTGQEPEPLESSHPKNLCEDISNEMSAIVSKATALDVNQRWRSAREMRGAISSGLVPGQGSSSQP